MKLLSEKYLLKKGTDELICRAGIETHREQTLDPVGEGAGGMNREGSTDIYTAMCETASQREAATRAQGTQPGALWLPGGVGWDGGWGRLRREGSWVYSRLISLLCGRSQHNIARQFSSN